MASRGLELEDATGLGSASEGIKTLASAVMPDPSKIAAAGYYGTRAREALIDAAKKTSEMNMMPAFMSRTNPGMGPVSGTYAPAPGIVGGPMMFTTDRQSIAMPAQPSLAATVAPGPAAPQLPPPGQVIQQLSRPDTPGLNTGSPPPASPPTPGSPPAPNATTSNGQVPQNDAQGVHPGSVTPPGGGIKMSGPAAPNGAPAPITPAIANFMAMGAAAGMPAEQMKMIGAAYVSDAIRTGAMDQNTGARVLAEIFDPSRVYHETAATGRTVLEQQGQTTRQGMVTGQQRYEFDQTPVETRDAEGNKTWTRRGALKPGDKGYDSGIATGAQTIAADRAKADVTYGRTRQWVASEKGGYELVTPDEIRGRPVVDAKIAQEAMENITVTTKDGARVMPRYQAVAEGLAPAPTSPGEVQGRAGAQAQATGQPPGIAIAQATPPKTATPEEVFYQNQNRIAVADSYYPPSSHVLARAGLSGIRFRGAAAGRLDALVDQLKQAQPNLDDSAAYGTAIRQLQSTGELPTDAELARPDIFSRFAIDNNISPADAKNRRYLFLDLQTPGGSPLTNTVAPAPAATKPPAFTGYGTYNTPPPARNAQPPAPAGKDLGPAPPRFSEGDTVTHASGRQAKVVNGRLIEQSR